MKKREYHVGIKYTDGTQASYDYVESVEGPFRDGMLYIKFLNGSFLMLQKDRVISLYGYPMGRAK